MRILLAEDRSEMRDNFYKVINDYRKRKNIYIEPILVKSLSELKCKLISNAFDIAIIDNNLSLFGIDGNHSLNNEGMNICKLLTKTSYFKDTFHNVILYSASPVQTRAKWFKIVDKFIGQDAIDRFENEILDPIAFSYRSSEVSIQKFRQYSLSAQASYYKKNVLNKINTEVRITEFKLLFEWISDILDDDHLITGFNLTRRKSDLGILTKNLHYEHLDSWISEEISDQKVPTIFWNFNNIDFINTHNKRIHSKHLNNNFIKLFYYTALSKYLADNSLNNLEVLNNIYSLIPSNNIFVLREIQCFLIEKLSNENTQGQKIKSNLDNVRNFLNLEIVDYFNGYLESFDNETDIASVRLISLIDPKKYFYQNLSYTRLCKNGIKYKDSEFRYCISEYENNMISYIEPK